MTLVKIDCDEWWPVYGISDLWGVEADVPDALIKRLEEAKRAFDAVQDELGAFYDAAVARSRHCG